MRSLEERPPPYRLATLPPRRLTASPPRPLLARSFAHTARLPNVRSAFWCRPAFLAARADRSGYWITRRKLHGIAPWPRTGGLGNRNGRDPLRGRGTHYFHSTFNDLVLSGLVGLRAHDDFLEVFPLSLVAWFAATNVRIRGSDFSVVWDASGSRYPHGPGLHVWRDGKHVGSAPPQQADGPDGAPTPPRVKVPWQRITAAPGESPPPLEVVV